MLSGQRTLETGASKSENQDSLRIVTRELSDRDGAKLESTLQKSLARTHSAPQRRAAHQVTAVQEPSGLRQAVPRATCGRPSI